MSPIAMLAAAAALATLTAASPPVEGASWHRAKRTSEFHITECMHMGSEEGAYYHKASKESEGQTCGAYFFAEPDQVIEITFNFLEVPCEDGGLVAVVDGWELNRQLFPSPLDHPKPTAARFSEYCGVRKVKKAIISSQNAALIQYRMPRKGTNFSFNVRFLKNPTPCNVLFQSLEDVYTLRNYGRKSNCSLSTLFPAAVKVEALNVGVTPGFGRGIELETGIIHKCQKRGLDDYIQIGGSTGLDSSNLILANSLCGLSSKPARALDLISCGTTTVRLVSSGAFDNSATVTIRALAEEDLDSFMSVVCDEETK